MIIDRYLVSQVTKNLFAVAATLLFIFVSGELVNLIEKVASGTLQLNTVLLLLGLNSFTNLIFVLPLSFYLAILLTFSRLYQDNEMVVLTACGIGQIRILRGLFLMIFTFTIVVGWLSLQLVPLVEMNAQEILNKAERSNYLNGVIPGRFTELARGVGVVYAEKLDEDGRMHNILLQREDPDGQILVRAKLAYAEVDQKSGERFILLEHGRRYSGKPMTNNFSSVTFEKHGIRMLNSSSQKPFRLRNNALPTSTLWSSKATGYISELQWRISVPISCIVLAILAIPLSRTSNRQTRYGKLAVAILLYIVYSNLLNVSRAWVSNSKIDPSIGLWWVHAVLIVFALLLWWQQMGLSFSMLKRKFKAKRPYENT